MRSDFFLKSLALRAVKKFDALDLQFAPGLNVLSGLNESGKSTVVLALRSVFLERAKSAPVAQSLKPAGLPAQTDVASKISVEFSFQGTHYQLEKNFAPVKSVRLQRQRGSGLAATSDLLLDDAAEEHVAQIWRASLVERGASAAKNQGLLGLLWVNQSDLEPAQWHEQAHATLGTELTRRAQNSVSARDLGLRIEAELATYLGTRNTPIRDYAKAVSEHELLGKQLQQWQHQSVQLQEDLQQLAELLQQEQRLLAQAGAEALSAEQVEQERLILQRWQAQLHVAQNGYTEQKLARQSAQIALDALVKRREATQKRQARLDQLQAERGLMAAALAELTARLQPDRDSWARLSAQLRSAESENARLFRALEAQRERQRLHTLSVQLQRHKDLEEKVQALAQLLAKKEAEAAACVKLRRERNALLVALQNVSAQATHVKLHAAIDLSTTISPRRGGQELPLNQELILSDYTEIELAEGLRLEITPASARDQARKAKLEQLKLDFAQAFDCLSAPVYRAMHRTQPELAPTPSCFAWLQKLEAQLDQDVQETQQIGRDLAAATASLSEVETTLDASSSEEIERAWQLLEDVRLQSALEDELPKQRGLFDPPPIAAESSEINDLQWAQAQRNVQQLRNQVELSRKHLERDEQDWHVQQNALAALTGQIQSLQAEGTEDYDLQSQIEAAQHALLQCDNALHDAGQLCFATSENVMPAMQLELAQTFLQQRESELSAAAQARNAFAAQIQANRQKQEHRRGSIEARFRQDIEVQQARTQAQLVQSEANLAQTRRKIAALQLLKSKLEMLNKARSADVAAPLQEQLAPYLEALFGVPTQVQFDAQFVPVELRRLVDGVWQRFAVKELSVGTREQLALLVRLAYADVLREAGAASFLVFDDVLAYSDPSRRQQFASALQIAAQRHQILLLSCDATHWSSLLSDPSVHALRLP